MFDLHLGWDGCDGIWDLGYLCVTRLVILALFPLWGVGDKGLSGLLLIFSPTQHLWVALAGVDKVTLSLLPKVMVDCLFSMLSSVVLLR